MRDDRAYFERRADDELGMAQKATDPAVVKIHYALLKSYLKLLHALRDRPGRIA
ncbi:hypothetical protein [Sphingomonas nostoxanthinifaciens]|uniref:hypothetical protein n=1 Tax=Sphingomonas nostoxanthinifaciens TaxID=2872652 RepID=UPI001CC1E83A|nr:hypothetical protein [Sphingomonas nostoxanthinifaciens]UAK26241.1 hypothetical protein K8P63_09155 [Sphingomonas nostoxanthinifaciens]